MARSRPRSGEPAIRPRSRRSASDAARDNERHGRSPSPSNRPFSEQLDASSFANAARASATSNPMSMSVQPSPSSHVWASQPRQLNTAAREQRLAPQRRDLAGVLQFAEGSLRLRVPALPLKQALVIGRLPQQPLPRRRLVVSQRLRLFVGRNLPPPLHTARAMEAIAALPPRVDTALLFPAPEGGYLGIENWRTRCWYPALEAAGISKRGPYHLRHTFATEALAAGVSTFELSRVMGTSIADDRPHYGHLARDSEDSIRARLDARSDRSGVYLASDAD